MRQGSTGVLLLRLPSALVIDPDDPSRPGGSAPAPPQPSGPPIRDPAQREAQLSSAFVTLADTVVSGFEITEFLQTMVDTCVALFDIDAAGLMLVDAGGRLRLVASSNEAARAVEVAQLAADAGPCLESYALNRPVSVPDIEDGAGRWPAFAAAAAQTGLRSSYATPMRLRAETIGTVNFFAARVAAMDDVDLAAAQALTNVATIGILQERLVREARTSVDQLQVALNSRVVIEQAKGVLATSAGLSMQDAFAAMRRYSRTRNTKLVEVARGIVDHTIDVPPTP